MSDHPLSCPALHASHAGIWLATPDGETRAIGRGEAVRLCADTPVIMLGAPIVGQRLGYADLSGLDLLELFAFVHPAQFAVPTARGLARALGVAHDNVADDAVPRLLLSCAGRLLATLHDPNWAEREGAWDMAQGLARLRWPWAAAVCARLPMPRQSEPSLFARIAEWEEAPPPAQPRPVTLDPAAVEAQLAALTGPDAEPRPAQVAMARAAAAVFAPRARRKTPHTLLAEAGTGTGKTLAYLAPASLWAREAGAPVHISTFTKNLQRQLATETQRIFPDPAIHKSRVVVRKGRENYLCLLNLEDALQGGFAGRAAIFARLAARWAAYTRDGDMVGGDMPGWLPTLFRRAGATALTDRRGECIYAGCPHWRRCFIETSARASRHADIVITNHALTMVNAARGREGESPPTRLMIDEGHHLFDAADSIFATALSGQEAIELRRWIIGPEGKHKGRRRGLSARLADLASYDESGADAIEAARIAALELPGEGWLARLSEGAPSGAIEALLVAVRALVFARDASTDRPEADAGYGLEAELADPDGLLVAAAAESAGAIDRLLRPLTLLGQRMEILLDEPPDWLDAPARARIAGALSSLSARRDTLMAWAALVGRIGGPADPRFVDWLSVERIDGREVDIGIYRRWLDPTQPLADIVLAPAHGVLVTSATLAMGDWDRAEARTGAAHLAGDVQHFHGPSPFDYARTSSVLLVTDVKRGDTGALAQAYARLIAASGGGTLGLFTAIRRLRAVHARIADHLARSGLPVYAQHVDPIDTGTLVDIFRDDPRASLLGTDALRDGVDVPGQSLRLVVLEGVPWVKPTVLHTARRMAYAAQMGDVGGRGNAYDDDLVRTRLAQAFGRLIRRAGDCGHFVLLSSAVPTRLLTAFPAATPIKRVTLAEAVSLVAAAGSDTTDSDVTARFAAAQD
ncbi:MAG: ATP-dependent DNA helicase [Sphingopyxis sp.]|nr:ATP-dependent DNA helicase [Sphingopyxis sp.]